MPESLLECLNDQLEFDIDLVLLYLRHQQQLQSDEGWRQLADCLETAEEELKIGATIANI